MKNGDQGTYGRAGALVLSINAGDSDGSLGSAVGLIDDNSVDDGRRALTVICNVAHQ